jgi:hypothetical protein
MCRKITLKFFRIGYIGLNNFYLGHYSIIYLAFDFVLHFSSEILLEYKCKNDC